MSPTVTPEKPQTAAQSRAGSIGAAKPVEEPPEAVDGDSGGSGGTPPAPPPIVLITGGSGESHWSGLPYWARFLLLCALAWIAGGLIARAGLKTGWV